MFQPFSKETLAALKNGDDGFVEYLATLSEAERNLVVRIFESPELLNSLFTLLPSNQQSATRSILDSITDVPSQALDLYAQCRFLEARELLRKTITLYELPDGMPCDGIVKAAGFVVTRVQALCHDMLGDVEQVLGNTRQAAEHHCIALELARQCGDRDTEAKALCGLGCYFWETGDFEQALEHSLEALEALEERADRWATREKVLNTLSLIHGELSQPEESLRYGEMAIAAAEERRDVATLPVILNNRSVRLSESGFHDEAFELLQSALSIAMEQASLRQEALIRRNIGMTFLNLATVPPDIEPAIIQFRKSLELGQSLNAPGLEAMACVGMGHALVMTDDIRGAEEQFRRASVLYRDNGAIADCAEALVELGNLLLYGRKLPAEALACYDEAIARTEQLRSQLKRESHRIGLAEIRTEPYHQAILTLLELGRIDEAFHYLERARSRALLELVAGHISSDDGDEVFRKTAELAKRIDELRHTLDEVRKADETGSTEESEETTHRAAMRAEIQQGLEQEERQFARLCAELRRVSPERHAMVAIQAIDSAAVQAILPEDTALVELYQTDGLLLIFVLRPEHAVQVVAAELTADDAAELVLAFVMSLRDPSTRTTQSHEYIRSIRKPASRLYESIITPLNEHLECVKRLVIVPHLFWHYLPFHALYDSRNKEFILDRFEISYAPSASVLEVCRRKRRHTRDSALILCRNDGDLPHVETEGAAIGNVFDRAALFRGSDATLDQVRHPAVPDVLHCACHGYFDPEQPFLSGIAIPPEKDEDRPTLLMDLLRLRLECSLVTLSACDTGLNTISNADELVGLSRGFFGAGAAALLLSLWKVSDSSTAYLMENFYWHYVANRQTKGKALQLAMQAVRARPEYAHPYYWAPFVVMGEWG